MAGISPALVVVSPGLTPNRFLPGGLMKYRSAIVLVLALMILVPAGAAGNDKDKDQLKLAVDDLKNEVQVLERQVSTMQQSMDRNSGQMTTLINQISDTVNTIKLAQSRVSEGTNSAFNQIGGLGDQLTSANQRLDQLSSQIAELKKVVQNLPKTPAFTQIDPGNPDEVFAAAMGDYHRGNYDLALSEFQGYMQTFPDTLVACSAQYWLGMTFVAKNKWDDAVQAFEKVATEYPKCEKVPMAKYQEAMALQQLGQSDAAQNQLRLILSKYKGSSAAELAKQALNKTSSPQ